MSKEPISECCSKPVLWIFCDGCLGYDEPHYFPTCSWCGADVAE
jgi:hypothetical protein